MTLPEVKLKAPAGSAMSSLLFAAIFFTSSCDAFFRNLMISDTAMARIDPIVDRGQAGAHVHHLNGGGNLDFESTGETLAESNCTNSILTQDKSAYWAPWLYFQHENGSLEDVKLALGLTAYYKFETRGLAGPDVDYQVFPKGLKMVSGDTKKREWEGPWPVPDTSFWGKDDTTQEALAEKAMGFNCMNYESGKNEPSFAYPWLRSKDYLDQNCINGIRAEIIFPSCWDGKNLDSDDHKSHLAFPTFIQDGQCPDTHPVYLPILFYETIWQTNAFAGVPGSFVFANGDPTGYGYHADFIAAWDDGVQEDVKADKQCTSLQSDGQVQSCPVFNNKIQSQDKARACRLTLPESLADEQVQGMLEELPGDVQIKGVRYDPGSSPPGGETYAPSTSVPATRSSALASNTAASSGYYHPAATSVVPVNSALSSGNYNQVAAGTAGSSTTSATAQSPAASPDSSTTTTYTSGNYVVELVLIEKTTTVTATTAPTMTQTVVINGTGPTSSPDKARHQRHARHHAHQHHRNGHF